MYSEDVQIICTLKIVYIVCIAKMYKLCVYQRCTNYMYIEDIQISIVMKRKKNKNKLAVRKLTRLHYNVSV